MGERKAKNELQRLRNIARQKKVKVPTVGVVTPSVKGSGGKSLGFSDELTNAAEIVKSSTASLGKFQPGLAKQLEKTAKTKGKKRQFESNTGPADKEKKRNVGVGIAANRRENRDNDAGGDPQPSKGKGKKGKKGGKGGKGSKGNFGSKSKGKGGRGGKARSSKGKSK